MKKYLLYAMSAFYILAGTNHFISPEFYLNMMPDYLTFHHFLNIISGIAEIFLGLLLLHNQYRRFACYGIILLLIAVFPANIYILQKTLAGTDTKYPALALWIRLPFQFLFIYWAWAMKDYQAKTLKD